MKVVDGNEALQDSDAGFGLFILLCFIWIPWCFVYSAMLYS